MSPIDAPLENVSAHAR